MNLSECKTMVMVLSCQKFRARQDVIRDTWGKHYDGVVFVEGRGEETRLEGDRLILPCPDEYMCLALKSHLALQWFSKQGVEYLIKVDDDCVIGPKLMMYDLPESADYMGRLSISNATKLQYACGGGYLLSAPALALLASYDITQGREREWWFGGHRDNHAWKYSTAVKGVSTIEDIMVADILSQMGIALTPIKHLVKVGNFASINKSSASQWAHLIYSLQGYNIDHMVTLWRSCYAPPTWTSNRDEDNES